MIRFLPDTSCVVALLCTWHEFHVQTRNHLEARKRAGDELILAAHSLVETYSVLTRLPFPFRLSESDSMELLRANWTDAKIIALTPREYWKFLRNATQHAVGGGQIYDALIACCALKGKAKILLTWNPEHFAPFEDKDLTISTPSSTRSR